MTKPSLEQKLLVLIRAARKKLEPARTHDVGLGRESVSELDRLLEGGEQELLWHFERTRQPVPSDRLAVQP